MYENEAHCSCLDHDILKIINENKRKISEYNRNKSYVIFIRYSICYISLMSISKSHITDTSLRIY